MRKAKAGPKIYDVLDLLFLKVNLKGMILLKNKQLVCIITR